MPKQWLYSDLNLKYRFIWESINKIALIERYKKTWPHWYLFLLYSQTGRDKLLDTVGVVCIDKSGHLCSGLSSGGIALKHQGRVGQVSAYCSYCKWGVFFPYMYLVQLPPPALTWNFLSCSVGRTTYDNGQHPQCLRDDLFLGWTWGLIWSLKFVYAS